MRIDIEQKRLNAIKEKLMFVETECKCCGNFFRFEKMWYVWRDGVNHRANLWCYCKNCMPTAEAVLHEIDTDACFFGIAGIDEHRNFKKDTTKIQARRPKHPGM